MTRRRSRAAVSRAAGVQGRRRGPTPRPPGFLGKHFYDRDTDRLPPGWSITESSEGSTRPGLRVNGRAARGGAGLSHHRAAGPPANAPRISTAGASKHHRLTAHARPAWHTDRDWGTAAPPAERHPPQQFAPAGPSSAYTASGAWPVPRRLSRDGAMHGA